MSYTETEWSDKHILSYNYLRGACDMLDAVRVFLVRPRWRSHVSARDHRYMGFNLWMWRELDAIIS